MTKDQKLIGSWLFLGAFLVLSMVVLGGYTRLSHSGLSMVEWKPITGFIPPLNESDWQTEFNKYKTSPEYVKRNYHFTLEEFRVIYWPEFLHRVLGRVIGIVFLIPFLYFLSTKKLQDKKLIVNLFLVFLLGGLQGFIGWYMVKSGLKDIPAVSHYRLAIHLCTALLLYCYILWTALGVLYPRTKTTNTENEQKFKRSLYLLLVFVCLQIIYGAFVAGLKAGLFYPTFPKMGDNWLPPTVTNAFNIGVLAITESPYVVQFIHRWLAAIVVIIVLWMYWKSSSVKLQNRQHKSILALIIIVFTQFLLGVFTILNLVPTTLGLAHQLGAVFLLSTIVIGLYNFKYTS